MPLAGKQHQARDIAKACYDEGWVSVKNLTIAVAVCLGESQGFDGAYHDNKKVLTDLHDGDIVANVETYQHMTVIDVEIGEMQYEGGGTDTFPLTTEWITTRDVGAFEINIPARLIGTKTEDDLYDWFFNVKTARTKWLEWSDGGSNAEQGWRHWASYDYAIDPNAQGHYIHKACRGVGNFLADYVFGVPTPPLLYYKGGATHFETLSGGLDVNAQKAMTWRDE